MSKRGPLSLLLWCLFVAPPPVGMAADLAIRVHRHRSNIELVGSSKVLAHNVIESVPPREFAGRDISISLPPGDWWLSSHSEGDWSEERLVTVGSESQTVDLNTYPLATLAVVPRLANGKAPHEIQAYFRRVRIEDVEMPPEGNVTCGVTKGVASCGLPSGEYDIALRVPGYVTRYRSDTTLQAGHTLDGGAVRFVSGSTLSGRVEATHNRGVRLERGTVVVRPTMVPGANDDERHRAEAARLTVQPTSRGFFSLQVPAGAFTVQATLGELVSSEVRAEVAAGHEAMMRQPLQLASPRSVTVHLSPPMDPWAGAWKIELANVDSTGHVLSERALKTMPDGSCRFGSIQPGTYRVEVVRATNQSWATRTLEVDHDETLDINVNVIRLTGMIKLGSKPLSASATLRTLASGSSVVFKSKADGTFAARLPAPEHDTWDEVEVSSETPQMKRTLQHVPIQAHDDGTGEMNLDLPSRSITGTVVDEKGAPAIPALIDVVSPDGSIQQIDSNDGSFSAAGLEAGLHYLRAATKYLETKNRTEVTLDDTDSATADVVLTVSAVGHFHGVIRGLDGPIPGAGLFAAVPGDETRPLVLFRTGEEGQFDIRLPTTATDATVSINAPGFAFRLMRLPLDGEDVTLAVDQTGGSLKVDVPVAKSGLRPYLTHAGGSLPAGAVGYLSGATFGGSLTERVDFTVPLAEAGVYSLCWGGPAGPSTACISGVLVPHGTLTLAEGSHK